MKTKLLISALALVLIGAGCFGAVTPSQEETPEEITGNWWLRFDLPEGWVMAPDYGEGNAVPSSDSITPDMTDIVLQSTSKSIVIREVEPDILEEEVETENFTYIRVFRLAERRSIPDEVEDLGNGFYREKVSEGEYEYYLETDVGKYQFIIPQRKQELSVAEEVIFSAKQVTAFE
ncbi:hypothetical protein IH979_01290 [Patescibacteria group bacterium]|nr:hypothetical protein [Patescibacteria group bacterium]